MVQNELVIDMLDFHAAHYLPKRYGKCNRLHGHTYTLRDIRLVTEGVVDFSEIKQVVEKADHTLLVPKEDFVFWNKMGKVIGCPCQILTFVIDEDETTVEALTRLFTARLLAVPGVKAVQFKLYETKNAGAYV